MAIIYNGTNIPTNGDCMVYNGVKLDKVIYNNVEVWKKETDKAITLVNTIDQKSRGLYTAGNSGDCTIIYSGIDTSKYKGITITVNEFTGWVEFRGMNSYVGLCAYQGSSMKDYLNILHLWCDWSVPFNQYSSPITTPTSYTFLWDDKISSGTINLYVGASQAVDTGDGTEGNYMYGGYYYRFSPNAVLLAK